MRLTGLVTGIRPAIRILRVSGAVDARTATVFACCGEKGPVAKVWRGHGLAVS